VVVRGVARTQVGHGHLVGPEPQPALPPLEPPLLRELQQRARDDTHAVLTPQPLPQQLLVEAVALIGLHDEEDDGLRHAVRRMRARQPLGDPRERLVGWQRLV